MTNDPMGPQNYSTNELMQEIKYLREEIEKLRDQEIPIVNELKEPKEEKPPIPIGSLCQFWDQDEDEEMKAIGIFNDFNSSSRYAYERKNESTFQYAKPFDGPNTPLPWQWNTGKAPEFPERNFMLFVEFKNKSVTYIEEDNIRIKLDFSHVGSESEIIKYAIVRY